jgi:hypothetical protein
MLVIVAPMMAIRIPTIIVAGPIVVVPINVMGPVVVAIPVHVVAPVVMMAVMSMAPSGLLDERFA